MKQVRLIIVCFALLSIGLRYGCNRKGAAVRKSPDKMVIVSPDDPRMNAAIEKARATVGTFIAALQSPRPGQVSFSLKAKFTDAGFDEHIWLNQISYDGTNFQGTVDNEPERVKNVKNGQRVTVAPAEISDWMFIENRKLVGGETVRALRASLTPAERAHFDKSVDFVVE
jgi:uncharacterized protein YegJ (DUF2314 family)